MKNISETLYGHLLLYKDGGPGKACIGILKISYGHNGLIEDSNLKYNIVNLQSSFRPRNLIGEGGSWTLEWLQVHLQGYRDSPPSFSQFAYINIDVACAIYFRYFYGCYSMSAKVI